MIFYFFAGILVISALLTVTLKNIFHCALFLIIALLSLAGLYFTLNAPLVGVMQLIVYVGAIMVLILFAIMLTSRISDRLLLASNTQVVPSFIAVCLFLLFTIMMLNKSYFPLNLAARFDPVFDLGRELMTIYLLPFEVISLLLLAALVGAVVIARKD